MNLADRLAGAVWGHLVGDAAGVPYEFQKPDPDRKVEFHGGGAHGQPAGTWSDDGALMLATLDSLLTTAGSRGAGELESAAAELGSAAAELDSADMGRRFLAWADEGAYTPDSDGKFDIGGTTAQALARLRQGATAEDAGGTDEHDNGNGSLMRILPIALVGRDLEGGELIEWAHRASRITHGHPVSQAACALYVLVSRGLLVGEVEASAALDEATAELRGHYRWSDDGQTYRAALHRVLTWPDRGGHGFVIDAFWSAWDAFAGADSYAQTIERAIAYGHDTDTTACIAGGLAGIRWGMGGIPAEWLDAMRGREIIDPMVERLIATAR